MSRTSIIETHPKKRDIVRALTDPSQSFRQISKRFGIDTTALYRYKKNHLMEKAAKRIQASDLKEADFLYDVLSDLFDKETRLLDACHEYLSHPSFEGRYFLGPRTEEVEVIYTEKQGEKTIRRIESLYNLVDQVMAEGKQLLNVRWKVADPRKLLLQTAETMNKHLELLGKIMGQITATSITINNPMVVQLQNIVVEATKKNPEVRQEIAQRIRRLVTDSSGT